MYARCHDMGLHLDYCSGVIPYVLYVSIGRFLRNTPISLFVCMYNLAINKCVSMQIFCNSVTRDRNGVIELRKKLISESGGSLQSVVMLK